MNIVISHIDLHAQFLATPAIAPADSWNQDIYFFSNFKDFNS